MGGGYWAAAGLVEGRLQWPAARVYQSVLLLITLAGQCSCVHPESSMRIQPVVQLRHAWSPSEKADDLMMHGSCRRCNTRCSTADINEKAQHH